MGTGSQTSERDRVLGERLLTIEWQQRELPETSHGRPRVLAADQPLQLRGCAWRTNSPTH